MDVVEYLTGYDIPDKYDALVTLGVILLALWGVRKIANVVSPSKERGAIENSYNTYVTIFSDKTGIPVSTIERALEEKHTTAQQKQNFFSAVAKFFRISKRHGNSAINPQDTPRIESEVISEIASDTAADLAKAGDTDVPFQNVIVEIRATDRDQRGKGWYGKIDGITERVKLKIFPNVDLSDLAQREKNNC